MSLRMAGAADVDDMRRRVGVRHRLSGGDDTGNAMLEFVILTAFLMIPLVYVIIAVLQVQGSAYGVTEATREAGRAFVEAKTSGDAFRQACTAATVALRNNAATTFDCASELHVSCVSPTPCSADLTPGQTIRVEIDLNVGLQFLPTAVFGQPLTVRLHAVHDEVVDAYRAKR
jgi:Flp pilus assembly protein TadG